MKRIHLMLTTVALVVLAAALGLLAVLAGTAQPSRADDGAPD